MKKALLTIAVLFFVLMSGNSYSLTNFNYKGIALNSVGQILPATAVNVQITISTTAGGVLYQETHAGVTTDQFGGFVVEVGTGTVVSGAMAGITATADTRIKAETNTGSGAWVLSTMESLSDAMDNALNEIGNYGWSLSGNTVTGSDFLGSTNNATVTIAVKDNNDVKNDLLLDNNQAIFRDGSVGGGVVTGDVRGQGAVDMQIYRTAATQVASGDYSTVGGGRNNTASGYYSIVGGGRNNTTSNFYTTVSGGVDNKASGDYSTVGGGRNNTAGDWYATVGGGVDNKANGDYSTVGGGRNNTAGDWYATVGGGVDNKANGDYSTVGGGRNNTAGDWYATVGGGYGNTASGKRSTVAGGRLNTASNNYATGGGGFQNTASGYMSTVGGGGDNTANDTASTVNGGRYNTASGTHSTVSGGLQAVADKYGQNAYASGRFASNGDAQTSVFVVRNETNNATATVLYLNGYSEQMTIPTNTTWVFRVLVGARNADGNANSASWKIEGMLDDNNLISTTTTAISNGPGWTNPTVMITGNNMQVQIQGAAGTTIRWVARVEVVEIGR